MAVIKGETVQKVSKHRSILAADFVKNKTSRAKRGRKFWEFVKNKTSPREARRKFWEFVKNKTSRAKRGIFFSLDFVKNKTPRKFCQKSCDVGLLGGG